MNKYFEPGICNTLELYLRRTLERLGMLFSYGCMCKNLFRFYLQHCAGSGTMPFLQQMKGLRRNEDAMKQHGRYLN